MQILKMVLFVLLVIIVVIFIMQNQWVIQQEFSVKYFLYKTNPISLGIILLIDFFLGVLLCSCCYIVKNHKLKGIISQYKKKTKQMEQELISLRNLPITETQNKESSFKTE